MTAPTAWKVILAILFLAGIEAHSQGDIPLGTWRLHISYNTIKSVSLSPAAVYAAASNGILIYDRADQSVKTLDKLSGLTRAGITKTAFDNQRQQLLVAYEDGTFDVIRNNRVRNIEPSRNAVITGSKVINGITVSGAFAYLSTDYGVIVFDLVRSEIRETWRDLGTGGSRMRVFGSTFSSDSIFLATDKGVIAGDLSDNLLDFNQWKRFSAGIPAERIGAITSFNGKVYAALDGDGIYSWSHVGLWIKEQFLASRDYQAVKATEAYLLVATGTELWTVSKSGAVTSLMSDLITRPLDAVGDEQGRIWIGDSANGLVTNTAGPYARILPDGPASDTVREIKYLQAKIWAVHGGPDPSFLPSGRQGIVSFFQQGRWQRVALPAADISTVSSTASGEVYFGSFGSGVIRAAENTTVFNALNSTLRPAVTGNSSTVYVPVIEGTSNGLWVTNYGVVEPLHFYNPQTGWTPFSFSQFSARYPVALAVDNRDNVYMALNPSVGGGLFWFKRENNRNGILTQQDGNGELPSMRINALEKDRDGNIWVGTDQGVAYFFDPESDAVKPLFENRFLLRDDRVTAIAVDGGNRKWMGTERGVWLFNPEGEAAIANFTTANSPLLSDRIRDITIDPKTGEVFFATERGIASYRSDATESRIAFEDPIRIYPNPVPDNFTGLVGITGLATDAVVKITDAGGRLVWQTQANGGTASWNVRDYNGKRVATGIFLVFAVTPDGRESAVGKIAVIN